MKRTLQAAVLCMFATWWTGLGTARGWAQGADAVQAPSPAAQTQPSGGTIKGTVKAGAVPLPGVAITATNTLTGKKYATTTDVTGSFSMAIPKNGRYVVHAELAAFANETQEVLVNAAGENGGRPDQVADFTMQLASRVEQQQQQQEGQQRAAAAAISGAIGRGMQSLSVTGGGTDLADASTGTGNAGAQMPTLAGVGDTSATDSVAVSGQMGQTNGLANLSEDDIRQRVEEAMARARQQGGASADVANAVAGMLGGLMGPGGPGGGGFGGGRGGAFMVRGGGGGRGGRGGFNPTQPHGAIFYQGGNGALDATNYSLTGAPVVKPAYSTNQFGITFAGSPFIPGLLKPSTKQFIFFNLTGRRNTTPQNLYATVPTEAERSGDFSQLLNTPIFDPITHQQFQCNGVMNVICANRITSQANSLLKFYPAPNIAVTGAQGYNYQTITSAGQNTLSLSTRYVRNFGQNAGVGGFRMRQRQDNGPKTLRQNINFGFSYSHSASDSPNVFLPLGGSTTSDGYNLSAGYTIGYGRLTNNATVTWNRSHALRSNFFTNGTDNPALDAGILIGNAAIASNPLYYGVPSLTFSGLTGLNGVTPSDTVNQTISFSDFVSWSHKKHNFRFGGDFRRVHADSLTAPSNLQTGASPLGAFTFTGTSTANVTADANGNPVSTGGFSFADFLLGLPQQSAIQAGLAKAYLRANVMDLYANDDWRILPNLTLNYGLRYEYFAPYTEKNGHLVNLDHSADFQQVAPVVAGQSGPYSGAFPQSLVNPDRTMFAPRLGVAYRPKGAWFKETVIRAGYGINYNTTQPVTFAQQLAFQPPFSVTQTNVAGQQGCGVLQLANAFNCSTAATQNNYSVNLNYRLGRVQIWNIDIQRTLPLDIVLNVGYNGASGGNLDMVLVPIQSAGTGSQTQPFNYETSLGSSRFHALAINARKRMQKGVSLQATYQYGHSIDNASSIGGSTVVPVQNFQNIDAEYGNSSFDIRHKLTGNWVFELPFGPNRAFFSKGDLWSKVLDGFSLSGDFTFASGSYFTPRLLATAGQAATGTNNSLRADRVFSQPIHGSGTILDWFNAAAFTTPPAGSFGTASRNSIEGPGTVAVDGSLSRTIGLGETRSFEMRVTANNVFNTVQYSGIDTTVNSRTFGQVTSTANMRRLTFIARYRF